MNFVTDVGVGLRNSGETLFHNLDQHKMTTTFLFLSLLGVIANVMLTSHVSPANVLPTCTVIIDSLSLYLRASLTQVKRDARRCYVDNAYAQRVSEIVSTFSVLFDEC